MQTLFLYIGLQIRVHISNISLWYEKLWEDIQIYLVSNKYFIGKYNDEHNLKGLDYGHQIFKHLYVRLSSTTVRPRYF